MLAAVLVVIVIICHQEERAALKPEQKQKEVTSYKVHSNMSDLRTNREPAFNLALRCLLMCANFPYLEGQCLIFSVAVPMKRP